MSQPAEGLYGDLPASKKAEVEPCTSGSSSRTELGGASHHERAQSGLADNGKEQAEKLELYEDDCREELGFSFPPWKKWWILSVIFLVQTSMNFNTSLYSNGLKGISSQFGVSEQGARSGAAVFLITYAFGCELWAPWSEEFGRKPILQLSLFFVNIWTLPVALAPNFATLMVGRALGGISSAGGSVTLGMIADIFEPETQQYAVAYIVFSSVGGSILGPIIGGFVEAYLPWRWTIWIQLIFGGFVQILHFLTVPETRVTVMLDHVAKKRRKSGQPPNIYGPNELEPFRERFTWSELLYTWVRPFRMFLTEPIVLTLSLLSGFSDALIFMCIQSFTLVYQQWGFSTVAQGLSFIPIGVGYIIAWLSFFPAIARNKRARAANPSDEHAQYESRLEWLLFMAPCLPIGLIIFAWTCGGPPVHWIGSMVGSCIIGIANYSIYMATIDYMICAYGPYSASATGGNGWSRDFLAGVLTWAATLFFSNIGPPDRHLHYAMTILFCIAFVLVIAVYVIYWKGPVLRKRSPFAESLANARHEESAALGRAGRDRNGPDHDDGDEEGRGQEPPYRPRRMSHTAPSIYSRRSSAAFEEGERRRRLSGRPSSSRATSVAPEAEEIEEGTGHHAKGVSASALQRQLIHQQQGQQQQRGKDGEHRPEAGERGLSHREHFRAWEDAERGRIELIREATVEDPA